MYEDYNWSIEDSLLINIRINIFIKLTNECQQSLKFVAITILSYCSIQYYPIIVTKVS